MPKLSKLPKLYLLVLRAVEARDEALSRQHRRERQAVLIRDGAAHALHEAHEEQRRARVAEGALGERELVEGLDHGVLQLGEEGLHLQP